MDNVAAAITGAGLLTQDATLTDSLEHQIWIKGADLCRQEEDIFKGMEGSGQNSLIETELTTRNGNGMKATYPLIAEFGSSPVQGGDRFTVDDFDDIKVGADSVSCDYHRFGVSNDDRAEEVLGMRGQLVSRVHELQGRQMGKFQCHHGLMTAIHRVNSENIVNPRGVVGQDNILSTDTLDIDNINRMGAMMAPLGGLPFRSSEDANGNEIRSYMVIPTVHATNGLNQDPTYKDLLKTAMERGGANHIWAGGYPRINGNIIREWNVIDQPGPVKAGSPLNPHAFLGQAIAGGTTEVKIAGGKSAANAVLKKRPYFEDFPLFAYPFQKGSTLAWTGGSADARAWDLTADNTFFVVVVNPPSAATDPDKWCLYEVNANRYEAWDGSAWGDASVAANAGSNVLQVVKRLGATDSGIRYQTLGGVTWDASVNTVTHPVGSLIYLATSKGVPLGLTPMFGARGLRRAWGKYKIAMASTNHTEAGFVEEQYTMSVFGHGARKDLDGRVPGISVLRHAIAYEGWNHPTPTA